MHSERAAVRSFLFLSAFWILAFLATPLFVSRGDTLTGEVRGTVFDVESRAPVPGVTMTLISLDRGWKKQVPTDATGSYVFLQLEPGNYTVVAEHADFYRSEKTDILIRLNQPKVVVPPFELRKLVPTPTQQITMRGEQTRTAIVDLSAPGPTPVILAIVNEPGSTSMVSLLDWSLRANYEAVLVHSLPLRGFRTFDQLALLSPGVFRVPFSSGEGPAVGIGVGTGGQFSVNGFRGRSNNFTVDGSDNNDEDIGVRRQGFVSLTPQSIESIQDFQIMTAGFPAEFGRNSGSMVNAVSRSGQSRVHGSLYGFFNDDFLNARNFFERPLHDTINTGSLNGGSFTAADFRQTQYGAVVGGPVVPEKLFYFVSAERQRQRGTALAHFVVPTAAERGLRIRNGFVPIDALGTFFRDRNIPYSDLAGQGVFSLYPLPNNPAGPFGEHNYAQAKRSAGDGSIFSAKLDHYLSSVHSFAARYNFTQDDSLIPFTSEAINSSLATDTRTQNISLFLNSTTAQIGNALRFSYGRTRLVFPPERGSPLLFGSALTPRLPASFAQVIETPYGRFGPFGSTGPIGQLAILPYSTIGVDVFNFPQGRVDNTFQVSDFVTFTRTSHVTKFGFDLRRSQLNSFSDRNSRPLALFGYGTIGQGCQLSPVCVFATDDGLLHGTDLAALGAPAGFLQTLSTGPVADTTIGLRLTQYDFFVQDDWKVGSNLTVNAGLRYEQQTVPVEVNGRIERTFGLQPTDFPHLNPAAGGAQANDIEGANLAFDAALRGLQEFIAGRKKIYDPERRNFAPHLGFAWDPTGDGKSAIRAGYSLNFDANLGAVTSHSRNVFPTFVPINLDPNFNPPEGLVINNPRFFTFIHTGTPLIRPGTLNSMNFTGAELTTALGTLLVQAPPSSGLNFSSNGLAFTLPEKRLKRSYGQHWLLSAQRALGNDYLVSVSYVGSRGLHLTRFATPNAGLVSKPILLFPVFFQARRRPLGPLAILDLPPTLPPLTDGRPQKNLGAYTVFQNTAGSDFHSLQLSLERRLSRGIQFRGNWVWSHVLDDVSDPFDGRGFFALPQDSLRVELERASANFDVRHRLTGFVIWRFPEAPSRWLRGWHASAIGEFQTGQPFTVNTVIDRNRDGNITDRLENGLAGRNGSRAPGIALVDLALWRKLNLSEAADLDLRVECFNLFNRTHFGIPVRILESPGFGRSYDTQAPSRAIRLAIKLSF